MIIENSCATFIRDTSAIALMAEVEKRIIRGEKLVGPIQVVVIHNDVDCCLYTATLVQNE